MRAILFFAVWLVAALSCGAQTPDQAARWKAAKVDPRRTIALDKLVFRYQHTTAPYQRVQALRANGVPAVVAFALFCRECDNDMSRSPAQGDSLLHRSINVPRGRIPGKTPPFAWIDAAEDAYYVVDHLDRCAWGSLTAALDKMESFNGFGYRSRGIAAPYLWSWTNLYSRGKYVADGKFSATAVDQQPGVVAILKRMQERGIALPF